MKILVADSIDKEGIEILRKKHDVVVEELSGDELIKQISEYDALLVRSRTKVTKDVINAGKKLKVIGRAGVGLDNIDTEAAAKKGIKVVNAPDASTNAVAELVIGHMLSLARNLPRACETTRAGSWEKKSLVGIELRGKTLGLIGFGKIGKRVSELASAFGMTVLTYDPYINAADTKKNSVEKVELDELMKRSDFISIHTPATKETIGLINADKLALMKPSAYIINCARGGIIDETALYEAARNKKIAGAALDVYEEEPLTHACPLTRLNTIFFTPHLGASTKEAQIKASIDVAQQILDILK